MIIIEELNEVFKDAKIGKVVDQITCRWNCGNFGGNELKTHLIEMFNKIIDKNPMPQEWETGMVINIHKKEQKANVQITEELPYCLQLTHYLQI